MPLDGDERVYEGHPRPEPERALPSLTAALAGIFLFGVFLFIGYWALITLIGGIGRSHVATIVQGLVMLVMASVPLRLSWRCFETQPKSGPASSPPARPEALTASVPVVGPRYVYVGRKQRIAMGSFMLAVLLFMAVGGAFASVALIHHFNAFVAVFMAFWWAMVIFMFTKAIRLSLSGPGFMPVTSSGDGGGGDGGGGGGGGGACDGGSCG